jgi:hypothetical protein
MSPIESFFKAVTSTYKTGAATEPGKFSAPRRRVAPVEEGSTQIIVDRSGS